MTWRLLGPFWPLGLPWGVPGVPRAKKVIKRLFVLRSFLVSVGPNNYIFLVFCWVSVMFCVNAFFVGSVFPGKGLGLGFSFGVAGLWDHQRGVRPAAADYLVEKMR